MISFVWSSIYPLMAGTGGSENYTIGHIHELQSRGIPTRIITLGFGKEDGRIEFPEIDFVDISDPQELAELDDTLIFVSQPLDVKTKKPSYTILHCPPFDIRYPKSFVSSARYSKPIVTSHHAAALWSTLLDIPAGDIPVVYPFADDAFSQVKAERKKNKKVTTCLFAGRLTPDKGIYTLMWTLHSQKINNDNFNYLITNAGAHTVDGQMVYPLVKSHPRLKIIEARKTPQKMAELMASVDILIMPSSANWWDEMFGIVSIEAQHAGARVVASNCGGIPETDCGGLVLVEPDNPRALEAGILEAADLGRLNYKERKSATKKFRLRESVDKLLSVINYQG